MKKDDGLTPPILPFIIIFIFVLVNLFFPDLMSNFFNNFIH